MGFMTRHIVSHCHADKHEWCSICCMFHLVSDLEQILDLESDFF